MILGYDDFSLQHHCREQIAHMALEDFERELEQANAERIQHETKTRHRDKKDSRRTGHHHSHHRRNHRERDEARDDRHRRKRRRWSSDHDSDARDASLSRRRESEDEKAASEEDEWVEKEQGHENITDSNPVPQPSEKLQRDAWMTDPSALEFDFTQKGEEKPKEPTLLKSSKADFELKIHKNELNKHYLENLRDGKDIPDEVVAEPAQHSVDYTFGDRGSKWRMTKLRGVYREAKETGRLIDDIAEERYGDLRSFDDAREEETELERRDTYGKGYVGKEKPSGELFQERKLAMGVHRTRTNSHPATDDNEPPPTKIESLYATSTPAVQLDPTALNRLKARMMKAKLKNSPDATALEAEYHRALAGHEPQANDPGVITLNAMESRLLSRSGEVTPLTSKRGLERGLVKSNDDMTLDDMVREERRTRAQAGG